MDADTINEAITIGISGSPIPIVDRQKLIDRYGDDKGGVVADRVTDLVREAVAMPIDWGNMNLAEGVSNILYRFSQRHPELSPEALEEIGRCVGWQLR
ncbi:hypothetical protein ABQE44_23310 [Mycolicibacterium sp. XJ2546]